MATNFPASLDTLTNPTSSDSLSSPSHSAQHANANDAIEALQAKVGINSSAVTSSHDYKIAQLEAGATGGKILQVVRVTKNDNFTTSSTSLVDVTGMAITITPTSATSNILIVTAFTEVHYSSSTDNLRGVYVIADSANNPISGTNNAVVGSEALTGTGSREFWSMVNLMSYDAPATTSATTYKLQMKAESSLANVRVAGATNLAQMYALEVSA